MTWRKHLNSLIDGLYKKDDRFLSKKDEEDTTKKKESQLHLIMGSTEGKKNTKKKKKNNNFSLIFEVFLNALNFVQHRSRYEF